MAKSFFIILVSLCITINISLGEDVCSDYDDNDCVHPDITKHGHFVNQWSVQLPGIAKEEARELLESAGFIYLGKIMNSEDLYLVTKQGIPEKHAMPNEKIIELLKKNEKVKFVAQKHVIDNSPDMIYSILDTDDVECNHFNPNTIELNDGNENLARVQVDDKAETDLATKYSRPVSTNHESVDTDDMNNFNIDEDTDQQNTAPQVDGNVLMENNNIRISNDDLLNQ